MPVSLVRLKCYTVTPFREYKLLYTMEVLLYDTNMYLDVLMMLLIVTTFTSDIQSTLVISNSKGLSEILRDIRSSTYQVCRIEEKII